VVFDHVGNDLPGVFVDLLEGFSIDIETCLLVFGSFTSIEGGLVLILDIEVNRCLLLEFLLLLAGFVTLLVVIKLVGLGLKSVVVLALCIASWSV
jgi:hypothetical protein